MLQQFFVCFGHLETKIELLQLNPSWVCESSPEEVLNVASSWTDCSYQIFKNFLWSLYYNIVPSSMKKSLWVVKIMGFSYCEMCLCFCAHLPTETSCEGRRKVGCWESQHTHGVSHRTQSVSGKQSLSFSADRATQSLIIIFFFFQKIEQLPHLWSYLCHCSHEGCESSALFSLTIRNITSPKTDVQSLTSSFYFKFKIIPFLVVFS